MLDLPMPFAGQRFDLETLDLLKEVFDDAWGEAQLRGPMPEDAWAMREKLACHVMDLASDGERDPLLLKFSALRAYFGRP